jgi:hypothetical protein
MGEERVDEYIDLAQEAYSMAVEMSRDLVGWSTVTESCGVTCSRRPNTFSNFDSFKAEMYFDRSPAQVSDFLFKNLEKAQETLLPEDISFCRIHT